MPAVAGVEIRGVDNALQQNIGLHLRLASESCEAPDWKVTRMFAEAEGQIREATEAFGYYRPVISQRLESTDECWTAIFDIDPGEAVRIRNVDMRVDGDGKTDEPYVSLLANAPFSTGRQLRHADYQAFKRRFSEIARRRGYFDAAFTLARLDVFPDELAADITLLFDTGPRYRFGEIRFEQDVITAELLRRYVDFSTGEPYAAARITNLYEALLLTGYFERIDIRTPPRGAPYFDVPVTIKLTAARPRNFSAGIGFGTDTGPKVRAGYMNRRRNRQGHQFEANASIARVVSEAGLSYRVPLDNPRAEWLNFDTGYRYEDTDTSRSRVAKAGVKRLQQRGGGWLETQFIDLSYEDFRIAGDDGTSFLLVPGLSWTQVRSGPPPRPYRGHRLNLQVSGTSEWIASDTSFVQTEIYGKLIRPLWSGARILARANAGFTVKDRFGDLPASVRFFAGGDFSVRGYDYEALGPEDETGRVVGGSHRLVGSVEIDQQIAKQWSVVGFADAGNAFNDFGDMDIRSSAGVGVRWYSPLGPIRLDVAFPLDEEADDNFRIHIALGPDL